MSLEWAGLARRLTWPALLLAAALAPLHSQAVRPTVIRNISVVDVVDGGIARRTVVVRGERVEALLPPDNPGPEGGVVVDGRDRYLIPGLWDMHVHLATRPEPRLAEDIALPLLLAHGVVGARDMGGPLERVLALRATQATGTQAGPRLLIAGPFLDGAGEADPSFVRVRSAAAAGDAVAGLAAAGVDVIKVQAALSAAEHAAIVHTAEAHRLPVAGHVPVAMTVADVLRAGQHSIEHVSPALVSDGALLFACSSREGPLHAELQAIERDRQAGEPAAIRAREVALRRALVESFDPQKARALGARIRDRGVFVVPTLVWSARFRPLAPDDTGEDTPLEYVPIATRERWRKGRAGYLAASAPADLESNARVAATAARAVAALHEGGAPMMAGTDTFEAFVIPGASLHEELRRLVAAGLTPLDALRAATLVPAASRGSAGMEGRIAPGALADLVLLDGNPLDDIAHLSRVEAVFQRGRQWTRADLDSLLRAARRTAARQ